MLTLQDSSLNWALRHTLRFGDTGVFPVPFEYEAIDHDWTNVRDYLSQQDVLRWPVRPHRITLAPKARYGFRVVTQLDPLDFLLFAAIIRELGADIETLRLPISSNIVFSYRFNPDQDGQLFDPNIGYTQFQERSEEILRDDSTITHVAVADIADFYPRIYLHRLENALNNATTKSSHVGAIMWLLSGWNGTETFGIPVGSAPVRLLAEITLSDIDESLLANSVRFVRFNDDFRFFTTSHAEGYQNIAYLADVLYRNHGLTLQPQKTTVVEVDDFRRRFLPTLEDQALDTVHDTFVSLLDTLGLEDRYADIDYDDLDDDQKEIVDSMNLQQLFLDEVNAAGEPDFALIRFILRRLGQLDDSALVDEALDNLNMLYPAFPDIIGYLLALRSLSPQRKVQIGAKVLDMLEDSIISELDYHRMWALDLFTRSTEWKNEDRFFALLGNASDRLSRRKLILAMGRARQRHWFQSQWRSLFNEPSWPRRALLAAASCMPADARKHWYRSVESRLDPLEKAVMRWAKANPF